MNPHFFTAPFYFAFIWFRVQGSRFRVLVAASPPFLEDGILVSPPSPRGEGCDTRIPSSKKGGEAATRALNLEP